MAKKRNYVPVVVGDVDVNKLSSPWGYVVLYLPKRSKEGKWKHFFKSKQEWDEFYTFWKELGAPYIMEVDDSTNPLKNYWRKHNG